MSKFFKKHKIVLLLVIYGIEAFAANLAHPVTPAYMNQLGMPSYMFGVVFAAMASTNFLFSSYWGQMVKKIPAKKALLIGCMGYAVGQIIFGFTTTKLLLTVGRLFAGGFVSAIMVAIPYYIISESDPETKGKNIVQSVTVASVMGTVGYFAGGFIGTWGINIVFIFQIVLLAVCGILFYVVLQTNEVNKDVTIDYSQLNPLNTFSNITKQLSPVLGLLFVIVFCANTGATSMSQNYSYYITNALGQPSTINGITKASVGTLALIVNYTITIRLVNKPKSNSYLRYLFLIITCSFAGLVLLGNNSNAFLVIGILIMVMDTVQQSMLQNRCIHYSDSSTQAKVLGDYNAMKSLGMIVGALVSGWIYDFYPLSPFIIAMLLFGFIYLLSFKLNNTKYSY